MATRGDVAEETSTTSSTKHSGRRTHVRQLEDVKDEKRRERPRLVVSVSTGESDQMEAESTRWWSEYSKVSRHYYYCNY